MIVLVFALLMGSSDYKENCENNSGVFSGGRYIPEAKEKYKIIGVHGPMRFSAIMELMVLYNIACLGIEETNIHN